MHFSPPALGRHRDSRDPPATRSARRAYVRSLLLAGLALAGSLLTACGDAEATPQPGAEPAPPRAVPHRPNVILVVIDTVRADRCAVLGYDRPTTPNLDALARESVVFRNAWSPAGWTGPAHASLFTGLRPVHHGYIETIRPVLALERRTLAEVLRDAGYRRGAFSCNPVVSDALGLLQGFEAGARLDDPSRPERIPPSHEAHAAALGFVRGALASKQPFLLFVNDFEPHLTYAPPEDLAARFLRGSPSPETLAAARAWGRPEPVLESLGASRTPHEVLDVLPDLYDAEIAALDAELGRFLEALRREGVLDGSLLVIASDHGELFGEHGLRAHGLSLHRAIRHVPLLVRYPRGHGGGRVVDDVVRLEDVFPTVLDVCGIEQPPGLDGVTLRKDDLSGRISRATWGPQEPLRQELGPRFPDVDMTPLSLSIQAVFDGRHHLMVRSDGATELYDLATDPDETDDLAAELPFVVRRLRPLLDD